MLGNGLKNSLGSVCFLQEYHFGEFGVIKFICVLTFSTLNWVFMQMLKEKDYR